MSYFRWQDEAGNYLDIDGKIVSPKNPNFEELTHIMYPLMSADAEKVLEELLESLVISYQLDADGNRFVLTTEYWRRASGANRTFVEIAFAGVSDFQRYSGAVAHLQRFGMSYSLREANIPIVIQSATIQPRGALRQLRLSLGHDFGRLLFTFESVDWSRMDTVAKQYGDDWRYSELDTGRDIDFYNPFLKPAD